MKTRDEILKELYAVYGTDSGILLGIKERPIVEAILDFTLNHSGLFTLRAERDEYRKALEQIAEHDGEILFPGNKFFSSVNIAKESLSKHPQP